MYTGRILEVDLANGKVHATPLAEEFREQYLGGSALNLRLFRRADMGLVDDRNRVGLGDLLESGAKILGILQPDTPGHQRLGQEVGDRERGEHRSTMPEGLAWW